MEFLNPNDEFVLPVKEIKDFADPNRHGRILFSRFVEAAFMVRVGDFNFVEFVNGM